MVELTDSIPSAPLVLPKLHELLQRKRVNTHDLRVLIELDPGLATAVLRMANSAYFMGEEKIESIGEAILRLGTVALSRLASTSTAARWLSQPVKGYGWETGDLCRSSLCVAVSCDVLARVTGLAPREVAYTAGLIHDVGKLALAYTCSEALNEVLRAVPEEYPTWEAAEKAILGFPSTEVSKKLLQRWGFGHGLIEVAANHLHPSRAADEDRALVTLVHAGKHLAAQLGYGIGADGFYYEVDEPALEEHKFSEEKLQQTIPEIVTRMEELIAPDLRIKALEA